MGGRGIADASPHIPVSVLCRPGSVLIKRPYHDFQVGVLMGRPLRSPVRVHNIDANHSA